ncbi:MAG: ABC transporter ATP-binding protein, partial [Myxococcaceae bacterium]
KQVAWVPQRPGDSGDFTVLELVLMGRAPHLAWWGLPSAKDVERALSILTELGLEALAPRRMGALSGGEQRLVLLARALVQDPVMLILDEPTAFLDLKHQFAALAVVRERARKGMAVLAVLHDVNLASAFADDVLLLRAGRVLATGEASQVLGEDRLGELYGVSMGSAQAAAGTRFFYPRHEK